MAAVNNCQFSLFGQGQHSTADATSSSTGAGGRDVGSGLVKLIKDNCSSDLTGADIDRLIEFANLHEQEVPVLSISVSEPAVNSLTLCAYAQWIAAVTSSINAMMNAQEAVASHFVELSADTTGLALVRHFVTDSGSWCIDLVQWTLKPWHGRVADIDEHQRVITIVPSGKKKIPLDFTSAHVVHPSIGLKMERVKKKERSKVPDHIIRLREMWQQAMAETPLQLWENMLSQIPQPSQNTENEVGDEFTTQMSVLKEAMSSSEEKCTMCGSNKNNINLQSVSSFITQCCVCLKYWHEECCKLLCDRIDLSLRGSSQASSSADLQSTLAVLEYGFSNTYRHTVQRPPHQLVIPDEFAGRPGWMPDALAHCSLIDYITYIETKAY